MSTLKDRIHEHLDINFFKDKESDKMSAESVPVQRTSGGESINSLALSDPCSLTIGTEYVFISQT